MQSGSIRQLVIVGGGTAGWQSAAFLAKLFNGKGPGITLVESADIGTVGVGEATIPPIAFFNRVLGLDEADFMRATRATFKLGIEFNGWLKEGHSYLHPFGVFGTPLEGIAFHSLWLRARKQRPMPDISDYSLSAQAARRGRFTLPPPNARTDQPALSYAYHFDATLYGQYLRAYAEKRGVVRIEATVEQVCLNPEDGGISHLVLSNGHHLHGDFFIDCSGFRSLLIGEALGVAYHDWSALLPADRAVALADSYAGAPHPFTRALAHKAGWQWRIPLQHRTGNGYVYASNYLSDDEAAHTLLANLQGKPLAEPRFLRFTTGRRHQSWAKNCVAIGLSSGFLEPLESTSIHLIQHGLIRLAAGFPLSRIDEAAAKLYNQTMAREMENIRDFIIFHYHANQRLGEPLWDYLRHMDIPDSLREKIALFKRRGLANFPDQTVFQEANWLAVMLGQGIDPEGYDPLAESVDFNLLCSNLERFRAFYAQISEQMPEHGRFLQNYCAAAAIDH